MEIFVIINLLEYLEIMQVIVQVENLCNFPNSVFS